MTLRCLLLLSLFMAGCKTASVPDKRQGAQPEQQELEASLPQSTETHENIARAMFPSAPDKTQGVDCFRPLTPEMSVHAVVQKCGRPDEEVGSSGIFIFVWHMADGSSISISTATLERIGDVRRTDSSGKSSSLLRRK
jgi:hypothetical protein